MTTTTTTHAEVGAVDLITRLGIELASAPAPATPEEAALRQTATRLHALLSGGAQPAPTSPDPGYDAWLIEQVEAAENDPRPLVPQAEVIRRAMAVIDAKGAN